MRVIKVKGTINQVMTQLSEAINKAKQTNKNATLLDLYKEQKEQAKC